MNDVAAPPTVLIAYGTRPEAIKLAPLVHELRRIGRVTVRIAVTGQHREMLEPLHALFGVTPDHDLDILQPRQSLTDIAARSLTGLAAVIDAERPAAVVVQGDTTSAFAGALAAFYARVPVVHVEAGLRTAQRYSPFPEEINRRLTTKLASLHLAPTTRAHANLLGEGVAGGEVVVTGNTVIDALLTVVTSRAPYAKTSVQERIRGRRTVVVTAHRRESWGAPMARTARALARLARAECDIAFVLPMHRNPLVRETLVPALRDIENVVLCEPLDYADFARLLAECVLVVTDSGGVQEEAPSLGIPVLVLRDTSERPEAIEAGVARLVGTDEDAIVAAVTTLLHNDSAYAAMARAVNPFGDGRAAHRCACAIEALLGVGTRVPDFVPEPVMREAASVAAVRGVPELLRPEAAGVVDDPACQPALVDAAEDLVVDEQYDDIGAVEGGVQSGIERLAGAVQRDVEAGRKPLR